MKDDVPEDVKSLRLQQIIDLQQDLSFRSNHADIGKLLKYWPKAFQKIRQRTGWQNHWQ